MFRSEYEIGVASLLDFFKIKWEYETQTFILHETGESYTPDFWLPEIGTIIEVKGGRNRERLHKPRMLQDQVNRLAPEDPFWSQRMLSVVILTPESMWMDCGCAPGKWCFSGAFVRAYCCRKWMIADPHGRWACRHCHKDEKYSDYLYYTGMTNAKAWGRLYDPTMMAWTP